MYMFYNVIISQCNKFFYNNNNNTNIYIIDYDYVYDGVGVAYRPPLHCVGIRMDIKLLLLFIRYYMIL